MSTVFSENLINKLEKIAWILLIILVSDVCIFGAGRMIEVGPLTFRMILLLLIFIICIPLFFKNIKNLFKSKYICTILFFLIFLIFSAFIGITNNNKTNLILTDIKGFAYFLFLPCAIVLINSYEKIVALAKTSMYSATIQALIHITFICFYIADVPWLEKFSNFCDERRFFYVSYRISSVNVRVSFLSLICLLLGIVFSIYFSVKNTSKYSKILYPIITAICCFSLFMSYTRSVYLAVFITLFTLLLILIFKTTKKEIISLLKHLSVTALVFCIIIAGFNIKTDENYFTYGLSRMLVGIDIFDGMFDDNSSPDNVDKTEDIDSFHQNTIISDSLRAETVNDLISNIKKSPIIGVGLGAEVPSRPSGLNEYFFLDLFSKMGIMGFASYLLPLVFMLIDLIRFFKNSRNIILLTSSWFCALIGFVAYSYFTPCMNSSVGILPYCIIMAIFNFFEKSQTNLEG